MACYNSAEYLEESIDSILQQTFQDFELIIIDDASTDESRHIIQERARQDRRISFSFESINSGPGPARNRAISMANGAWLAILDCDDVAAPNRLEKQVSWAESHPGTYLLGSGYTIIDSSGRPLRDYGCPNHHRRLISRLERGKAFPAHSSCLYSKATVQSIGGFNPRYIRSEDADLWFRISEVGNMACLPEPLVKIRKHASNISNHNRGIDSIIMGMAASVCHFTRLKGASDPSQATDAFWDTFVLWLSERLEETSYFDVRRRWSNLRQHFYSSVPAEGKLKGVIKLGGALLTSGHARQIVKSRLVNKNLALQLADEWNHLHPNRQQDCPYKAASTLKEHASRD